MFGDSYDDFYGRPQGARNPMAAASVILGILSILTCSGFYLSLPCGAMAIICAILSRGRKKMPDRSHIGLVCGIIGISATLFLTVSAASYLLSTEEGRAYLEYSYQIYTGDYDFELEELLGGILPAEEEAPEEPLQTTPAPGNPVIENPVTDNPVIENPGSKDPAAGNPADEQRGDFI